MGSGDAMRGTRGERGHGTVEYVETGPERTVTGTADQQWNTALDTVNAAHRPMNQPDLDDSASDGGRAGERALQQRLGTRKRADRFYSEQVLDHLNALMCEFVQRMEMFFLATSDEKGECDSTFRAGTPGFLRVFDERTLAYPEYRGNGVFASLGNIERNPHVALLLMDFQRDRIGLHINGRARVVSDADMRVEHPELPVDPVPGRRGAVWVEVIVEEAYIHCAKHVPHLVKAERKASGEGRAWGTDDNRRKGGDYFGAAAAARARAQDPPTARTTVGGRHADRTGAGARADGGAGEPAAAADSAPPLAAPSPPLPVAVGPYPPATGPYSAVTGPYSPAVGPYALAVGPNPPTTGAGSLASAPGVSSDAPAAQAGEVPQQSFGPPSLPPPPPLPPLPPRPAGGFGLPYPFAPAEPRVPPPVPPREAAGRAGAGGEVGVGETGGAAAGRQVEGQAPERAQGGHDVWREAVERVLDRARRSPVAAEGRYEPFNGWFATSPPASSPPPHPQPGPAAAAQPPNIPPANTPPPNIPLANIPPANPAPPRTDGGWADGGWADHGGVVGTGGAPEPMSVGLPEEGVREPVPIGLPGSGMPGPVSAGAPGGSAPQPAAWEPPTPGDPLPYGYASSNSNSSGNGNSNSNGGFGSYAVASPWPADHRDAARDLRIPQEVEGEERADAPTPSAADTPTPTPADAPAPHAPYFPHTPDTPDPSYAPHAAHTPAGHHVPPEPHTTPEPRTFF